MICIGGKETEIGNQKLISQINKDIKRAENEIRNLEKTSESWNDLQQKLKIYQKVVNERKFYITKDYLSKNENNVEVMISKIHSLFLKAKETEFDAISQNNPKMEGAFNILKKSRQELGQIEKVGVAFWLIIYNL